MFIIIYSFLLLLYLSRINSSLNSIPKIELAFTGVHNTKIYIPEFIDFEISCGQDTRFLKNTKFFLNNSEIFPDTNFEVNFIFYRRII